MLKLWHLILNLYSVDSFVAPEERQDWILYVLVVHDLWLLWPLGRYHFPTTTATSSSSIIILIHILIVIMITVTIPLLNWLASTTHS